MKNNIRFAEKEDVRGIMEFIGKYWKKDHIIAINEPFFLFQHNIFGKEISFVISKNENREIEAVLGYIPYSEYDRDIMTVLWKSNAKSNQTLGIELLDFLIENGDVRIAASPGINKKTRGIYQYMGYFVGKMTHWYRIGKKDEYKIAQIVDAAIPGYKKEKQSLLIELGTFEQLEKMAGADFFSREQKPYKSPDYIKHRYYDHPIYQYKIYGICDPTDRCSSAIVLRKECCNGSSCLRLVDCLGDKKQWGKITCSIDKLLEKTQAEYIDMYETGIEEQHLLDAGWRKVKDSGNIIPNYFQPYVRENIDIYYFTTDEAIVLFKADGDQDRPN